MQKWQIFDAIKWCINTFLNLLSFINVINDFIIIYY